MITSPTDKRHQTLQRLATAAGWPEKKRAAEIAAYRAAHVLRPAAAVTGPQLGA